MRPIEIAWRSLRARSLQSLITIIVIGLSVAVALSVLITADSVKEGIKRASGPFDMIVGAKGSETQLVMNTIFLQETPLGNLPHVLFERLAADPRVVTAIPVGMGDNYHGYRIVGTEPAYFAMKERPDAPPYFQLAQGALMAAEFEAVIGATAASRLGLRLGDQFTGAHGVAESHFEPEHHADHPFTVVGILKPTGGPTDLGIYTTLESVWEVHGEHEEGDVTAILVRPRSINDLMRLYQEINNAPEAQAVFPGAVLGKLFELMGQGQRAFDVISYVVLGMGALTVVLSLYGSMAERRREVAILRSLGARRGAVVAVVLWEAILTGLAGLAVGVVGGHGAAWAIGTALRGSTGLSAPPAFAAAELPVLGIVLALSLLSALLPALSVYRVEAARHLAPHA